MDNKRLKPLLIKFRIRTHHYELFEQAFTHPSLNLNAHHKTPDYQRLEYVGDSVLGACVASLSYKLRNDLHEGHLTRLRSSLVDTNSLSKLALSYNFDQFIKLGPSFTGSVKNSPKILEDVFEAFIGAVYLTFGFNYTYKLVSNIFKDKIINFNYEESIDYKSKLQELLQADHHCDIEYRLLNRRGPTNNPSFKIGLFYDHVCLGTGIGGSKKKAEQAAAQMALSKLAKR